MKVYTGGTFDLFHSGHVNFLKRCKDLSGASGELIVSLNSDDFIERYKGKPPIYSYQQRLEILKACKYVDDVILNEGDEDSKITISKVKPDILAIGSDWASKDYYGQMKFTQDWLNAQNIILVYIPYTEGVSSTLIKTKL